MEYQGLAKRLAEAADKVRQGGICKTPRLGADRGAGGAGAELSLSADPLHGVVSGAEAPVAWNGLGPRSLATTPAAPSDPVGKALAQMRRLWLHALEGGISPVPAHELSEIIATLERLNAGTPTGTGPGPAEAPAPVQSGPPAGKPDIEKAPGFPVTRLQHAAKLAEDLEGITAMLNALTGIDGMQAMGRAEVSLQARQPDTNEIHTLRLAIPPKPMREMLEGERQVVVKMLRDLGVGGVH